MKYYEVYQETEWDGSVLLGKFLDYIDARKCVKEAIESTKDSRVVAFRVIKVTEEVMWGHEVPIKEA